MLLLQHKTPSRRQLQRVQCASHVDRHPPTVTAVDPNVVLMVKTFTLVLVYYFWCLYGHMIDLVYLSKYWGSKISMCCTFISQ